MHPRFLAVASTVLALLLTVACSTSGQARSDRPVPVPAAVPSPGCDTDFPARITDPGFPSDLVVCGDKQPNAHYRVANETESVWLIRTAQAGVPMLNAGPLGSPPERVRAFRSLRGIVQGGTVSNPYQWIVEPGTTAVVTPGLVDAVLEVDKRLQGAWSNFSALEKMTKKAGSTMSDLIRSPRYRTAAASCVTFGFTAFDVDPNLPRTTQTLIEQLRAGSQGLKCASDLDLADRERALANAEGRTALRPINSRLFTGQLSESASVLDRWLEMAGKIIKSMPKHG
jgi:hypothetical protein